MAQHLSHSENCQEGGPLQGPVLFLTMGKFIKKCKPFFLFRVEINFRN